MEIQVNINIRTIRIKVAPIDYPIKDIVGFADLDFIDENNKIVWAGRGYMIKAETLRGSYFKVCAPLYGSRNSSKARVAIIFSDKNFWKQIEKEILQEFHNLTGGKSPKDFYDMNIPDNL